MSSVSVIVPGLVSVIVPIYDVEQYLCQCIDSIINQTFRNLEIILIDDGSPDNSSTICDKYAAVDNRIRVIHQKNGGLSAARNAGLDVAKGEYIYFLDSDDYIESNLIETAVSHMGDDTGLVAFGFYQEKKDSTQKVLQNPGVYIYDTEEYKLDFFLETLLQYGIGWEAWSRLFRRDIIEANHLRFADNRKIFAEDLYFSLCYCAHIKKVIYLSECLYHYNIREDSIMGKDVKKINIGRMNELSKAVKNHFEKSTDCTSLLSVFPVLHYLIIDNSIQQMLNTGCSKRDLRKRILENVQDRTYFLTQLKRFPRYWRLIYKTTNKWKASECLNICRYIVSGSYTAFRIRRRLFATFHVFLKRFL